ncbi:MAG: Mrp/NBP35 family ATP-binding protein [Rhodobacteraceae bacterium]|nr:Mrp/NBP35 family ATP-binding protein [Paracoccaceae bacterium]
MTVTREQVLAALGKVNDPASSKDIVSAGVARAIDIEGGVVRFVLEVEAARGGAMEPVRLEAIEAVEAISGVSKVSALVTAHSEKAVPNLGTGAAKPAPQGPQGIPGVRHIIAVASGKGGVGKSTVSANIAVAMAQSGLKVGLLDADIYGPSQPRMMGTSARPKAVGERGMAPVEAFGVKLISMGLMMREDEAVVWRGPMLMGALQQMLNQVAWGALDVLVIDLPPGTGDVQLSLAQKTAVTGAIVVSTPQDIALLDARKALDMFRKTGIPVLGIVENMSTHVCSECGHEEHIFGHGGAVAEAKKLNVPLLGEVPLDIEIRLASDAGAPVVAAAPDSPQAEAFRKIAENLLATKALNA